MVPSSSNRSPMTCAWSVSFLLYARALATMRAYFSAERSSLAANAALCAALRDAPDCSTPIHANTPTPRRRQTAVNAASIRNARHMPFPQQSGPSFATRVIHVVALDDPIPIHTTYRSTHVNTTGGTTDIGWEKGKAPGRPQSRGSFRMPSPIWRGSSVTAHHACGV